jgi:excisionase family DNA binding protein
MATTHPEKDDDYVTVSEAARLVFMSADTIRRYSNKGSLATVRTPAGHRRVRRSDVLALLTVTAA